MLRAFQAVRRRSFVVVASAVLLAVCVPTRSQAAVINLTFSGTYDTRGATVFGQSGAAVPYLYSLTYDTALDTNTIYLAAGVPVGGLTPSDDWYGYSASGVIASQFTFGTQTWTAVDLWPRTPVSSYDADLWFNTDLGVSAPTLGHFALFAQESVLFVGDSSVSGTTLRMRSQSRVEELGSVGVGLSDNLVIAGVTVPEPASMLLFGIGLAGAALRRWRR
jgi:hypothetical protein